MQHTATHYSTLQLTATHCNTHTHIGKGALAAISEEDVCAKVAILKSQLATKFTT